MGRDLPCFWGVVPCGLWRKTSFDHPFPQEGGAGEAGGGGVVPGEVGGVPSVSFTGAEGGYLMGVGRLVGQHPRPFVGIDRHARGSDLHHQSPVGRVSIGDMPMEVCRPHRVGEGLVHHADIRKNGAGLGYRGAGAQQVGDQLPGGEVEKSRLRAGGVDRALRKAQTRHAESLFVHSLGVEGVPACGCAVHDSSHAQEGVVAGQRVAVGKGEGVAAGGEGGGFTEMGVKVEGAAKEVCSVGGGEGE